MPFHRFRASPDASPGRLRSGLAVLCSLAIVAPPVGAQTAGDDGLDDAIPTPVGAAAPAAQSVASQAPVGPDSSPGYERAPIRWNGVMSAGLSGGAGTTTTNQSVSLNGDSFVVAPYIAQVGGGLSVTQSQESASQSSAQGMVLGGRVALFNRSRWPTTIGVSVTESSVSGRETSQSSTGRSIDVAQIFRPADDSYVLSGNLGLTRFSSSAGDVTTSSSQSGSYSPRLHTEIPQTFNIEGLSNTVRRSSPDPGVPSAAVTNRELRARHSIDMTEINGLRFDSNASMAQAKESVSGAGGLDFQQVSSAWNFLPEDMEATWTLNGNLSASRVVVPGGGFTTYQTSATLGNRFSSNWSGGVGLNANMTQSTEGVTRGYGASASLAWSADPRRLGAWTHGVTAGGGAGVSQSGQASTTSQRVSLGQSLLRQLDLPDGGGTGQIALGQSLGVSVTGGESGGNTQTLTHTLSSSWQRAEGAGRPISATVSALDTRSTGVAASWAQSIAASGSTRWVPTWRELVTMSGGLDFTRQGSESNRSPWRGSGHLSVQYNNQKLFDVPRLRGSVDYRMVLVQAAGREDSSQTYTVNQIMNAQSTYRLGLLDLAARASLRMDGGGQITSSFGLSISRSMGGTL